jgi:hypothetical protein
VHLPAFSLDHSSDAYESSSKSGSTYRLNGSPPLKNRTKGLGKKSEQCLT